MRSGGRTVVLVAAACAALCSGCTSAVPGAPAPSAPPRSTSAAPASGTVLSPDALPDECLLDAAELTALVGARVDALVPDGRRSDGQAACTAAAGGAPVAQVNVYGVRGGTPAHHVRAAGASGRREIDGVGQAAVVVGTDAGPVLQVASTQYLVTIQVTGREPADAAWAAAGAAALARLPE